MSSLVTLTGAFKNAGDYLIGHRARALLAAHTAHEIIDVNRRAITDEHYELFNSARAVLLTGGPAYQQQIFPKVFDLDLSRIKVPVIAYGLGWKGKLGQAPDEFRFDPAAGDFVRSIHSNHNFFSSARDHLTVEMLVANGVTNVRMTGCPAWYDESKLTEDYRFDANPKRVVLSMPAVPQPNITRLLMKLAKDFPKAKKFISYQAGFENPHAYWGKKYTAWNHKQARIAKLLGFQPISFESDFPAFEKFMSEVDFHIGYRVHSHIFTLSQRKSSILIAEDSRGVGQVAAMGGQALLASAPYPEIAKAIDVLFATEGAEIQRSVETMRATHRQMLDFMSQLA